MHNICLSLHTSVRPSVCPSAWDKSVPTEPLFMKLDILCADWHKECPLFNGAGTYSGGSLRRVGADSLSQTVYRNDFLILVATLGIGIGT